MPRKCCADICKTNDLSQAKKKRKKRKNATAEIQDVKICVFDFLKDPNKRPAWFNALPNKMKQITWEFVRSIALRIFQQRWKAMNYLSILH